MKLKLRMFGGKITHVSINICTTMENKREEAWTHEETVLLIELWGYQRVQICLKISRFLLALQDR